MNYYDTLASKGFYIICEIGVNYYEIAEQLCITPIEAAKLMMLRAKENGADAAKFQTYKAGSLVMKDSPGAWDRNDISIETQYELFQLYDKFGEKEYAELSEYGKEIGITFISTPFDLESADYLDKYMDLFKISSSDISNIPLLTKVAQKNKPIILSTGASNFDEIEFAVNLIKKYNSNKLTLLHCVLEYPTPSSHANLNKILSLKEKYPECIIGYSDHTYPDKCMDVLKTAYILGAQTIEKHFTLDKTIKKRNDHFHSMDCDDLKTVSDGLAFINTIRGSGELVCLDSEITTRNSVRRSAVSKVSIPAGTVITEDMVIYKRPGNGLPPIEFSKYIGKSTIRDVLEDTLFSKEDFE